MKKKNDRTIPEEKGLDLKPIPENETFTFSCYPGISCFNVCCCRIDVILTPFDVLFMKNRLGVPSDRFLADYTFLQKLKGTDIPLVKLKMHSDGKKKDRCVFLGDDGCRTYGSRPAVCRNYPLGTATQDPKEGSGGIPCFIVKEDMCKGHFEKRKWSATDWKKDQGVLELDELNRPWLEIVAKLKKLSLKDDRDQKMNIFVMTCFDLDTFRKMVFHSSFLERFDIDQKTVQLIESKEKNLLQFGFRWLNFALFGEGPIKPKPNFRRPKPHSQ